MEKNLIVNIHLYEKIILFRFLNQSKLSKSILSKGFE